MGEDHGSQSHHPIGWQAVQGESVQSTLHDYLDSLCVLDFVVGMLSFLVWDSFFLLEYTCFAMLDSAV